MENNRDYVPKLDITINQILDKNTMQVGMYLEHKSNWQDGAKKSQRRNKFMFHLKQGLKKFDIQMPGDQAVEILNPQNLAASFNAGMNYNLNSSQNRFP
jgi:hypothetical protein